MSNINSVNGINENWLEKMYAKEKVDQQSELKKLFVAYEGNETDFSNDVTKDEKQVYLKRQEFLAEKLEALQKELEDLQEDIEANQAKIAKQAAEITNLVLDAKHETKEIERKQKNNVNNAISDAIYYYKTGGCKKDEIGMEIQKRLKTNINDSDLMEVLDKLNAKQAEVAPLIDKAAAWADKMNFLDARLGVTKSAYDLLTNQITKIGTSETNYTNADTSPKVPIYSLAKLEKVETLFATDAITQPSTNTAYKEGSKKPSIDSIAQKYKDYLKPAATNGVDPYSANNNAVKKLGEAIDKGLLNDLLSADLTNKELTDFLVTNFANAKINYAKDGKTINVPYGHGNAAHKIFNQVATLMNDYNNKYQNGFLGANNTWDKDKGNTISSNKQIAAMFSDNADKTKTAANYANSSISKILEDMGKNEPKFTFKEAMYALFNPQTGLFKDSGVTYDLNQQSDNPNYSIDLAGDSQTANMYKAMANQIKEIWGVECTKSGAADSGRYDGKYEPNRTDPMSFRVGNTEFAFIIDRDKDGTFTNASEFVGGKNKQGISWLDDLRSFDADGNGKLTGDELKNIKILSTTYEDNAKVNDGKYLHEQTTELKFSYKTLESLGITEIDFSESKLNDKTGRTDMNDAEVFNDSVKITLAPNSELNASDEPITINASRKDDSDEFIDAVYKSAYGRHETIDVTEADANRIMNENYAIMNNFIAKYSELFGNIAILETADEAYQESLDQYEEAKKNLSNYERSKIQEATNKVYADTQVPSWEAMKYQVIAKASQKNVSITDYALQQMKGIFVRANGSADSIVDEYIALQQSLTEADNLDKNSDLAWDGIVECIRAGIQSFDAETINELIKKGEVKTAEDIVEYFRNLKNNQ